MEKIGKYTVQRELGEGGFGRVYLAFDPELGQPVAIKKIRTQGDPDLLKRFQLEVRTTAGLRHKNIVTIHASGEESGDPYLVMEFLEGQTLKQIIHQRSAVSLLEKVRIMTQVAEGLAYAHSKGVVHRDVKPENIMVLPDGEVKIMDFGIALAADRNSAVTQTGGIIGTPSYFAPEQLEGAKANEQTDIFSFGDVYYELLAGVHPFEEYKNDWRTLQIAIVNYEPRPLGDIVTGCPEALETLVHRTLAKDPEFRYRNLSEILLDSEAILVDLRREGAAAIVREAATLQDSGELQSAISKINYAYQLDPGNREIRRIREELNALMQRSQAAKRAAKLLAEAERQMSERRYAEAVHTLESGVKTGASNTAIAQRLEEARQKLDSLTRANRLVAEARAQQQQGLLSEAENRLEEALKIDPEHTDARRLSVRLRDELERRRREELEKQVERDARALLAARRFADALAALDTSESQLGGVEAFAALREEIEAQEREERRIRAERFRLAIAKTDETMQAGDFPLARQMLDHLQTNFGTEPGAGEVLRGLRERLESLVRARDVVQLQEKARGLLRSESFREAVDLLSDALAKYPHEPALERLKQLAQERDSARQRASAIANALREASAKRDTGDLNAALDGIAAARHDYGDDPGLVGMARQLESEIEQRNYREGLERLLRDARELLESGKYPEAAAQLEASAGYAGETEVRELWDAVRAAEAREKERRENAGRIGMRRAAIRAEIEKHAWDAAQRELKKARADFPGDSAFDDLAREIDSGVYRAGWLELEQRVKQHLDARELSLAERELRETATRTVYVSHPQWKELEEEVAKRKRYEEALMEADRQRTQERYSEAEQLLTAIIERGPPDDRALQMRRAVEVQHSESSRQREVTRIAQEIRDHIAKGEPESAQAQLAAARSRYPGESVWNELQAAADSLRRAKDIAGIEADIRQLLASGEIAQAAAKLASARARYAAEAAWSELDREIDRRWSISAAEEKVRQCLNQPVTVPKPATTGRLFQARGEALENARGQLAAARAAHPEHAGWKTLDAEIAARNGVLEAERQAAGEIERLIEAGDLSQGAARLATAKRDHPRDELWALLAAQIQEAEERRNAEAAAGRLAHEIEQCLEANDIPAAAQRLSAARTRFPGEAAWERLAKQIETRETAAERERGISAVVQQVSALLHRGIQDAIAAEVEAPVGSYPIAPVWDVLANASRRLADARSRYAGDSRWDGLEAEIAARRSQIQEDILKAIRYCSGRFPLDWNAGQLAAARTRYPHEPFWRQVETELAGRREAVTQDVIAQTSAAVRRALESGDVASARAALNNARGLAPDPAVLAPLQAEIEDCQAQLDRRRRTETLANRIRQELDYASQLAAAPDAIDSIEQQWRAFRNISPLIDEGRANYPEDRELAGVIEDARSRAAEWSRQTEAAVRAALEAASARETLDRLAPPVRALRAIDPNDALAQKLERELEKAEARLNRLAEAAQTAEAIRALLRQGDVPAASARLHDAKTRFPRESWEPLESELDARRRELAEGVERVESLLAEGRAREAVETIERRFAHVPVFAEPLERGRRALEQERQRELREQARRQMLALEERIRNEPRKRQRLGMELEARQLAAGFPADTEFAAIAERIHVLAQPAPAGPCSRDSAQTRYLGRYRSGGNCGGRGRHRDA